MLATSSGASLQDRYTAAEGAVFLTGIQALVRLILEQQRLDRARGRRTAGFVSGYEGSPLAGLDLELARRGDLLREHDVTHLPGLNEELAATAIGGTQLAPTRPDAQREGVVGYWYGKAPGLDRASDALRHANLIGTHPLGGALALVGDDPLCKSSSIPSASELALADLGMPTVCPADQQDILDLGLHAIAMSRASGLWSAMKIVTNVADGAGVVRLNGHDRPVVAADGGWARHQPTANLVGTVPVELERTAQGARLDVARDYARRNNLDVVEAHGRHDRLGIVAAGKTYLDVRQALDRLGLDAPARERHGIRLLKLGLIHPLEPTGVAAFADGLDEIVVVEEKRPFLEAALKEQLYGRSGAPAIVGKRDRDGSPLVPQDGELDPDRIAGVLSRRVLAHADVPSVREWLPPRANGSLPVLSRTPYFCSGCPHNRSTQVPDGSLVGAGIGCHAMVLMMGPEQVGDVVGVSQMGGEGAQWLGMAPYVASDHLLQNLGDGTFHHSGSLAIRAAVAAGANMTFKLLYNSAVAMTGGQEAVGVRTVPQLTELLRAEGVARVIVTTEDLGRYRRVRLAAGAQAWHRDRLEEAQRTLAATRGVTVLIHDQECATEKRRRRKRQPSRVPEQRVLINERVCEGCGDCGAKSNCLSVEPVDTEYGRKTQIHQASCNTDYSCLDGDCPSFVTVRPATGRRAVEPAGDDEGAPPDPVPCVQADDFTMRITGIGGTGVVTVAQIVASAAYLAGLQVKSLDQTGLSQKAGPVVSDIKVSRTPITRAGKLGGGECDLYLGCDVLVAADPKQLTAADPRRTVAVVSTGRVPTGQMIADTSVAFPEMDAVTSRIAERSRAGAGAFIDARALATEAFGGDQFANVVLLGAAYQAGALPLPLTALHDAIRLNGVAVEQNLRALTLGRRAAAGTAPTAGATPAEPDPAGARIAALVDAEPGSELARIVADRSADLVAYQSARYAKSYARTVEGVRRAEAERTPGRTALAEAVARHLYKLMAYKDEYEVARLSLDPALHARVEAQFGPGARYAWRFHPPALRALGLRRKIALGRWATPLLVLLRAGRRLRGTPLDVFGLAHVRRVERRLIAGYRAVIEELLDGLDAGNHTIAVEIAALPDLVRGYEQIKLAAVERYEHRLAELQAMFTTEEHK